MRYKLHDSINIANGQKVNLTYFVSIRNDRVLQQLRDMPSIEELRRCLKMYHKDEIWLTEDQK